jgi:hypothetical protein
MVVVRPSDPSTGEQKKKWVGGDITLFCNPKQPPPQQPIKKQPQQQPHQQRVNRRREEDDVGWLVT